MTDIRLQQFEESDEVVWGPRNFDILSTKSC